MDQLACLFANALDPAQQQEPIGVVGGSSTLSPAHPAVGVPGDGDTVRGGECLHGVHPDELPTAAVPAAFVEGTAVIAVTFEAAAVVAVVAAVPAALSQDPLAPAHLEQTVWDVGLDPSATELLPAQQVDEEVSGGVDADQEVGEVHNLVDERRRGALRLRVHVVAVNHLVDVGEHLERLADDEHEGDGDQEAAQLVLLALLLERLQLLLGDGLMLMAVGRRG